MNENFNKNMNAFTDFWKFPEVNFNQFQNKQLEILQQLQKTLTEIPTKTNEYVNDQQQKLQSLNTQVLESLQKQPADFENIIKLVSQHAQDNTTYHVEKTKENIEQLKKLVTDYNQK